MWMELFFNVKLSFQLHPAPSKKESLSGLCEHGGPKVASPPTPVILKYDQPPCLACWQPSSSNTLAWLPNPQPWPLWALIFIYPYCPCSNVFLSVTHLHGCSQKAYKIVLLYFAAVSICVYCLSLAPALGGVQGSSLLGCLQWKQNRNCVRLGLRAAKLVKWPWCWWPSWFSVATSVKWWSRSEKVSYLHQIP